MRVPEWLFPLANRVMALLLCSPLHFLASGSIMLVRFTGRRSGVRRATPVRYLREGADGADGEGRLVCLTSRRTAWWHNFREAASVELQLAGQRVSATAEAFPEADVEIAAVLRRMLVAHPSDAAYHGIDAKCGPTADEEQLRQAVANDVLVAFTLDARQSA